MTMFSKYHLLVFSALFVSTFSLYIHLHPNENFCLAIPPSPNTKYKFHYQSLGEQFKVMAQITSQSFRPIQLDGRANATQFIGDTEVSVCFRNGNKVLTPVGIDFYGEQAHKLKNLALKSDMEAVQKQILQAAQVLNGIARNSKFQEQKMSVHSTYIEKHESTINLYSKIKIGFVILVAVVQVWLFGRYIKQGMKGRNGLFTI